MLYAIKVKLENLIPTDKFDCETVELLYGCSFEEIEPIIPKLLEWLQDGNWPISRPMGTFLLTLPQMKLVPYIMEILDGDDQEWKYFMIGTLASPDLSKLDPLFLNEIKRIAFKPTEVEVMCEVNDIAQRVLE